MSIEGSQDSLASEQCNNASADARLENVEISRSTENGEEEQPQDYRALANGKGDDSESAVFNKPEDSSEENEAKVTPKILNGNPKGCPKLVLSIASQTARNQIQPPPPDDNQLDEREVSIEERLEKDESSLSPSLLRNGIVHAIDCLFATAIVAPMVVAHWRGIWELMDLHLEIFTGWRCFGAGMGLHLIFTVTRHTWHAHFAAEATTSGFCGQLWMRLVRTLYTYAFSLACNCHWRGIWILLDDWFGKQAGVIFCFTCAVLGNLLVLRCTRNLLAPPLLVNVDSPDYVFQFPTRLRSVYALCVYGSIGEYSIPP